MIQIIAGKKGSGKTKRIIDMTNEKVKDSQHDVVFIDDDNRYMIFIDAFKKLVKTDLNSCEWFFERLEELCQKHNVDFVLSVSEDPENLPEFMKGYLI